MLLTVAGLFTSQAGSQQISKYDCERAFSMLNEVAKDVETHYYDPKLHGLDWEATVADTKQKIKSSPSFDAALTQIAQALLSLNDSHTLFEPPPMSYFVDYGFHEQIIGDRCYITHVRPGSDAEAKGLTPGDELLAIGNYRPARETLWMMEYRYYVLWPAAGFRLALRDERGQQRQVDVMAKFTPRGRTWDLSGWGIPDLVRRAEDRGQLARPRWAEVGDDVAVLKLPTFMLAEPDVKALIKRACRRPGLILDLRGNPGGRSDTLSYMLGAMFAADVKIGDRVGRRESKPMVAKSWNQAAAAFGGKLVVLVDSRSASASELFARVVQLEKRGLILGDRSAGSVMEATRYHHDSVTNVQVLYGAEISDADIIMSDWKSLEHTGVTPDELVLPTAADLASGRDPVLSRAAALLGATITSTDAGKMFPYEWPKE